MCKLCYHLHRLCNHCADFAFNCTNVRFAVDKMICSGWITQQAIGKYWMTRSQADRYMYYVFNIYSILLTTILKKTCNIDATCQIIFRFYFLRLRIILFIKKVIKYFFLFDYFSYLMCCNFYPSYTLLWLLMIIQICYLIVNYFSQISIEKKHYWNLFCIQNDINQISESYIYQWLYIKSTNMTRKGHCY